MKQPGSARALQTILTALAVALLTLGVIQLNAIEKRVSTQEQQLRALGESSERMVGELGRMKGGVSSSGESKTTVRRQSGCEIQTIRHPDLKDFLGPQDIHWPPDGANTEGVLTKGWSTGDPKGFNAFLENGADIGEDIVNYTDLGLASRNKWTNPDTWYGDLACRVEITDDYKEYTIYLRRGVMWHVPAAVDVKTAKYAWLDKPHEFTADDLIFGLDILMNPQVENGSTKNYYQELESWKALDPYTVQIRWKKKVYLGLGATLGMAPLPKFLFGYDEQGKAFPKETIGLRFNQHWYNGKGYVGTGPYRLSEYVPGVRIVLERNDDFFGEKPAIKRIVYPIYTDPTTTVLKMKAGELQMVPSRGLSPGQYREEVLRYLDKPKDTWPKNSPFLDGTIKCNVVGSGGFRYLGWNMSHPLFRDAKVRTAMTLALNRKQIIANVFAGLGEIAMGPFLPATGYLDPTVDPLDFDLGRASRLLSEAGWVDSDKDGLLDKVIDGKKMPFEFTLLVYGNRPEYKGLASIFKEDLLKIGIKLNIAAPEWSLMQKRMEEKNFEAYTGGWGLAWETDPYQIWHSSQADIPKGSNVVSFRSKEADSLMERLRETFDPKERQTMLRRIHRLIYDEQPYTFFMTDKTVVCTHKDVQNVSFAKVRPIADLFPWWVAAN